VFFVTKISTIRNIYKKILHMTREEFEKKFKIVQIFVAKAGFTLEAISRRYYGTLDEKKNPDGTITYYAKVHVKDKDNDSIIYSMSNDRTELQYKMDSLVVLNVYKDLHKKDGVHFIRYGMKYYLN